MDNKLGKGWLSDDGTYIKIIFSIGDVTHTGFLRKTKYAKETPQHPDYVFSFAEQQEKVGF